MKVLVTGANGFIGKNLCGMLINRGHEVLKIDIDNLDKDLENYIKEASFICHLAGVNRPLSKEEFYDGNFNSTVRITDLLIKYNLKTPIMLSSSTQALFDSDYGKSKKRAEDYLFNFRKEHGNQVYVYRFHNVFGKWCRPNYNSVVATFCYNIAHDLEIKINDESAEITFVYIDDICKTICDIIDGNIKLDSTPILYIKPIYNVKLGHLANLIKSFKESRKKLSLPKFDDEFVSKLYATYLSYLPENDFSYDLDMHIDDRGSFTEFLRTDDAGQVSINVGKPGIVKGNHYHNTKNEKYLVVKGTCSIKFRKINDDKIIEYITSDKKLEVVDIPVGYTHSITNIGNEDSVTVMWASEPFNKDNPDTYFEEVLKNGK